MKTKNALINSFKQFRFENIRKKLFLTLTTSQSPEKPLICPAVNLGLRPKQLTAHSLRARLEFFEEHFVSQTRFLQVFDLMFRILPTRL